MKAYAIDNCYEEELYGHMWIYDNEISSVYGRWPWGDVWVDVNYVTKREEWSRPTLFSMVATSHMWILKTCGY